MIIIDAFLFILIVAGLHLYKAKYPNFLFFCKGAMLFLPPDDQQQNTQQQQKQVQKQQHQHKSKSSSNKMQKQKKQHAISIIQVEYNQVKTYPFCTQFQRIVMTITGLLGFYVLRAALSFVLPPISHLPFYILVALFIYTIKVSVDIFMLSAYKSKTTFSIAFFLNLFYIFLALALGTLQGVYDQRTAMITSDYSKFIQIILANGVINNLNQYIVLGMVIFINFFVTLAAIPSIVKFGNWYSKTLKQVYYKQQQNQQNLQKYKKPNSKQTTKQSTKQAEKQLKQHSKNTVSLLNYYLIANLVFLFLSHRFLLHYVEEVIVDCLRLIFFAVSVSIILWTSKDAVQYNGAFAYKHVIQYFRQKSKQAKLQLRKKIIPYIYHIWYHFHQFLIRIMVPIILIYLLIHWKYLAADSSIQVDSIKQRSINYDIQCSINTNQFDLIKNLYKCPIKSYRQMESEQYLVHSDIISGILSGQNNIKPPAVLQQKLLEYGILRKQFMVEFIQLMLWYANITIYGMTVVYVLFLRKTVYQI